MAALRWIKWLSFNFGKFSGKVVCTKCSIDRHFEFQCERLQGELDQAKQELRELDPEGLKADSEHLKEAMGLLDEVRKSFGNWTMSMGTPAWNLIQKINRFLSFTEVSGDDEYKAYLAKTDERNGRR